VPCQAYRALVGLLLLNSSRLGFADDVKHLSVEVFQSSEEAIVQIEKDPDAAAAKEEIAVAKGFVENGNLLFRAGHTKKAALYAERLQLQMELIRAIIAAKAADRAEAAANAEILELENELKSLRARYQRMLQRTEAEGVADSPASVQRENH
jgi:hypothetical protein